MKVVIFGGNDREEQMARKVCNANGVLTATALASDGKPVHAGNAYQAAGFSIDQGQSLGNDGDNLSKYEYIIFECSPRCVNHPILAQCDHHNKGDYGYGMGPLMFWEASSLGQLCTILGVTPTEEMLMIAAGDHCPAAAYKGLCPGIDPAKFKKHRIEGLSTTVECPGVDPVCGNPAWGLYNNSAEIEKHIDFATILLQLAPMSIFEGVKDLRAYGKVDQLPEAALIAGFSYLSQIPETDRAGNPTGNIKVNLGGDNSPETVTKVIEWLNGLPNGISDAYGVPVRGFAGRVFKSA